MNKKLTILLTFITVLLISGSANAQTIDLSCAPPSAGTGATISFPVWVDVGTRNISAAFGAYLTFNTGFFQYQGTVKGDLTQTWADVDGGLSGNTVTFGGYRGAGNIIYPGSSGTIAVLSFLVTCNGCSNGQTTQICIDNYIDDIRGYTPEPDCTTFTFITTYPNCKTFYCKYDSECQNCCSGPYLCDDSGTCDPFSNTCEAFNCQCSTGCGAECGTSSDCPEKCEGSPPIHSWNGVCTGACTCSYSTENCNTKASTGPSCPHDWYTAGSVRNYIGCSGSNCGYNDYPDACLAGNVVEDFCVNAASPANHERVTYDCDNDDGSSCSGTVKNDEDWICSNRRCYRESISSHNCANDGGQWFCRGSNTWRFEYNDGVCRTDGTCSSGSGNAQCVLPRIIGNHQECSTLNTCAGTCGTGTDSCTYEDHYCSGASCDTIDGDYCCSWSGSGAATCATHTDRDPDLNTGVCTGGVCCSTPVVNGGCGLQWNVGGSGDCTGEQCLTNCCGDDSNEVYESCVIGFDMAWSTECTSSDMTCCDSTSCVDPTQRTCYDINNYYDVLGIGSLADDTFARCAGGGGWRDCDESSTNCGGCAAVPGFPCTAGSACFVFGGESSGFGEYATGSEEGCCGDDYLEIYQQCEDYPGSNMAWGCDSSDEACCNAYDCINNNDNCLAGTSNSANYGSLTYLHGNLNPGGNDNYAFCYNGGNNPRWLDCDTGSWYNNWCSGACGPVSGGTRCGEGAACSSLGEYPDSSTMGCCGDDSGEFYNYFNLHSGEQGNKYGPADTSDNACCDNDADCVYNGACYSDGYYDLDSDGRIDMLCYPDNGYGYDWWINVDYHSSYCTGRGFHWNVAGGDARAEDSYYTTATGTNRCNITASGHPSIQCCCGDDLGEEYRTMECDGYVCTSDPNDKACCGDADDCVWNSVCYNNGVVQWDHTCVDGVWEDTTAPRTVIEPNGVWFDDQNETSFNLTCTDSGSGCSEIRYRIITPPQVSICQGGDMSDLTDRYTPGTQVPLTCLFGQVCDYLVCFASNDNAGNEEAMNISELFHLNTSACQGKGCGQPCASPSVGICEGDRGNCYNECEGLAEPELSACLAKNGCFLECTLPSVVAERYCYDDGARQSDCSNFHLQCNRTGAYKCSSVSICQSSLQAEACGSNYGGGCTQITANWNDYYYPSGYYTENYTFTINLSGITTNPGFTVLSECLVERANNQGNMTFNNWGSGSVNFSYTIQGSDSEGQWDVINCSLWSDFSENRGWELRSDNTRHTFIVDMSPPLVDITNPQDYEVYANDFTVNATVTDAWSPISSAWYRWENSTQNGTWQPMTPSGIYYNATFHVNSVSDGIYSVRVRANDSVGFEAYDIVLDIVINRKPPDITILLPQPGWKNSDFEVRANVNDSEGIDSIFYRWENSSENRPWIGMYLHPINPDEYYNTSDIHSVSPGNYTIRFFANDTLGNQNSETVGDIGVDYLKPISQMTEPSPGSYTMGTRFNISWISNDNPAPPRGSGVDCHYVVYEYCNPSGCYGERNVSFPDNECTSLAPPYLFEARDIGIQDLHNYTFFFKSRAVDNADNFEGDKPWETNVTIFITKLVTFSVRENATNRIISNYDGRVGTNRTVVVEVQAKENVQDNLNIRVCYYNDTLDAVVPDITDPRWDCSNSCSNTRSCNASMRILASEAQELVRTHYYIYAENASDASISEYLPRSGHFYYTVYHHPLCNFLVKDIMRTTLGSSELIAIHVRNILERSDVIGLRFSDGDAKFIETHSQNIEIQMAPGEGIGKNPKIIYARLVPSGDEFLLLTLVGNSSNDPTLSDTDEIDVLVGFPADFPGLSNFAVPALILLAVLIYARFVKFEN